jgi:hypothetical protein
VSEHLAGVAYVVRRELTKHADVSLKLRERKGLDEGSREKHFSSRRRVNLFLALS